jgi:hypothetical protein
MSLKAKISNFLRRLKNNRIQAAKLSRRRGGSTPGASTYVWSRNDGVAAAFVLNTRTWPAGSPCNIVGFSRLLADCCRKRHELGPGGLHTAGLRAASLFTWVGRGRPAPFAAARVSGGCGPPQLAETTSCTRFWLVRRGRSRQ